MMMLKGQELVGKGSHRAVYRHPDDESLCVKVMIQDWRVAQRRLRAHWFVRMCRPKWYFHENLTEYRYAKKAERRLGEKAWSLIPKIHGLVDSDLGEGMVVDLVRDHDGRISLTLEDYLRAHGLTEECQDAIDEMWVEFKRHKLFVQGRPSNLVLSLREDGTYHTIPIDGFAFPQLIPVARWIPAVAGKKYRKAMSRQKMKIERILSQRESAQTNDV